MNKNLVPALALALLLLPAAARAVAPVVSNLTFAQRAGTRLVDISYDVTADMPTVVVSLEISSDGGITFSVPATTVSGAVGAGVAIGTGKIIIWDAGANWIGQLSARMRFKVTAYDAPAGFSFIPAGAFTMGDSFREAGSNELPTRTVTLTAFYMGQKEVTKTEWEAMRTWAVSHGYTDLAVGAGRATNHPVQMVSWFDAIKWCNARSEQEGLTPCYTVSGAVMKTGTTAPTVNWAATGYRLPTEAEWEKAARGGLSRKRFSWGDTISHTQANFYNIEGESYQTGTTGYHPAYSTGTAPYTAPVGSFTANGYGLHDMAGNVAEWCWDWYGTYASGAQTDPRGAALGSTRMFRGGSWSVVARNCRAADRANYGPGTTDNRIGFRPARSSVLPAEAGSGYAVSADGVVDTRYELTSLPPANGTISGVVADGKYLTGTTATLTAVPAAGYVFTGWTGAASGTVNPLSLVMNSDRTIGATYVRGIEVLVDGQLPAGSEVVGRGSLKVTMQTAFANGTILYTLDGSAPSLGSKLYTTALTIGRSCTVRAVAYSSDFSSAMQSPPLAVVIVPVLSATTAGGGGISVEPPAGAYAADAMATLTATPAAGWTFLQWLGDASGTEPVARVQMSRNKTVQAVFGTAVNTTTVGSGSIWQNPLAAFYPYGTRIRFSGLPASGNYLAFWGNAVTSTDNPLDFPVTQPNLTVTAVFQPLAVGQFALALVAEGGGKVAATPAANRYSSGASVRVTAQPDLGQEFVGWSGDAAGSSNPLTVAMSQSKAITAVFTKRPRLRVGTALEGLIEEGFRLTLTGEFGKQYEILGSTDLVNWMQAGTLTNVYGTSQFTDGSAKNQPRRFYRAVRLEP